MVLSGAGWGIPAIDQEGSGSMLQCDVMDSVMSWAAVDH